MYGRIETGLFDRINLISMKLLSFAVLFFKHHKANYIYLLLHKYSADLSYLPAFIYLSQLVH